jgi:hypothetical protein
MLGTTLSPGMCHAYPFYEHCIYLTYAATCLLILASEFTRMLVRISRMYPPTFTTHVEHILTDYSRQDSDFAQEFGTEFNRRVCRSISICRAFTDLRSLFRPSSPRVKR